MPGVVDEDVEAALFFDDPGDGRIRAVLPGHVQFHGVQGDSVLSRVAGQIGGCLSVAAGEGAHARVDRVPAPGERADGVGAETAGGAGDENDLAVTHDCSFPALEL